MRRVPALSTSSSLASDFRWCAMLEQSRAIRNLHQYPTARHKRLVKDRRRFARNWYLHSGNNNELVETHAHEREAFERFGEYKHDSNNDKFILSTANLKDLPAADRLSTLGALMKDRWEVRDGRRGFDKCKMMLEALECFSEMRRLGQISVFSGLPEDDQDLFLQYVESCAQFAKRSFHGHPDAVGALIRTAEICDEMECTDKRDEILDVAERCAHHLGRALVQEREGHEIRVQNFNLNKEAEEYVKHKKIDEIAQLYPNRPELLPRTRDKDHNSVRVFTRVGFRPSKCRPIPREANVNLLPPKRGD